MPSFARKTLPFGTTLQNYNFSMNSQGNEGNFLGSSRLCEACHPCGGLCNGLGSMLCGAVLIISSFSLERKVSEKFKAKTIDPPHGLPKRLTFKSGSAFCEGKRQAPLHESQAFSPSLGQPLPRVLAPPPRPTRSVSGKPVSLVQNLTSTPSWRAWPAISCALGLS